jgi:hypothetical protein
MEATKEFLRTLRLDLRSIQYLETSLVNGSRGLHVTINNRAGYPALSVRQVSKDMSKVRYPTSAEDVRALGRWLDMGDE